jgi:flavin reductase (DIM6/NTAB) family NADH-FMN oxidoreductase RutF
MNPQIISFAIQMPSTSLRALQATPHYTVNVLSNQQVAQSVAFSSPKTQREFGDTPHYLEHLGNPAGTGKSTDTVNAALADEGLPILLGSLGTLVCKHWNEGIVVGDHYVCFGLVERIVNSLGTHTPGRHAEPLLYYQSGYRSIGDQVFLQAFQGRTLSFHEWTHRAHVRFIS